MIETNNAEWQSKIEEKKENRRQWQEAMTAYLAKNAKGVDYRTFLLEALLKDDIVVEQADWILERMDELPMGGCCDSCECEGACHTGGKSCCKKCQGVCQDKDCQCHTSSK